MGFRVSVWEVLGKRRRLRIDVACKCLTLIKSQQGQARVR